MFTGQAQLRPLDNDRYPDLHWTCLRDHLTGRKVTAPHRTAPQPVIA